MNSKFFDLKKEKQDRIINGALKIFASQGYRHGSTDDIVREAGISKGLLFHYFGSKLGVYGFVYDYSVRYMILELRSMANTKEKDLFQVMKHVEGVRVRTMKGYPYMQQFLNRSSAEDSREALLAMEEKRNLLAETYAAIEGQIDYSLLPLGIDGERLRRMLDFTVRGLMAERFQEASFQPDLLYQEICGYLDMMRQIVYRE